MPSLEMRELLRSLLSDVLDDLGFELQWPGQAAACPQLLLVVVHPGDDVGQVIHSARVLADVPVLLVLSFADEALRRQAVASGASGVYTLGDPLENLKQLLRDLRPSASQSIGAPSEKRVAMLVESTATGAPAPAAPAPEPILIDAHGVRLTPSRLEALGQAYPLAEVRAARALREGPRLVVPGAVGLGIAIAVPAVLSALHVLGTDLGDYLELGFVLAGLAVFVSLARLLLAQDTWWLMLETTQGTARAYRSADPDFVHALVGQVIRAISPTSSRDRSGA